MMNRKISGEFQERLSEVDTYLEFLSTVETQAQGGLPRIEGSPHPISPQQQRILYSSVYLQLYNLVEATIVNCIDAVSKVVINNAQWKPGDLSESLLYEWVRLTAKTHVDMNPEKRLETTLTLCNHLIGSRPITTFDFNKGGGGNWDDSAIEELSNRLGCNLKVSQPVYQEIKRPFRDDLGALALVKQLRNRLAHGSISFAQCAEDVTVDRLIELKDTIVNYLKEVIDCFNNYIERHEYLLLEKRPVT